MESKIKSDVGVVSLSLREYNELRDFKVEADKALSGAKFSVITRSWGKYGVGYSISYYTESEAILDFEKRNNELHKEINDLETQNRQLKAKVESSLDDIKKMSYWEFRKWRKSKLSN